MEIDLKNFAATLAVGTYILVGLGLLARGFLGIERMRGLFLKSEKAGAGGFTPWALLVLSPILFVAGMVLEDLSDQTADYPERHGPSPRLWLRHILLPQDWDFGPISEEDSRNQTFIDQSDYEWTSIAREIGSRELLPLWLGEDNPLALEANEILRGDPPKPGSDEIEVISSASVAAYYQAKNVLMTVRGYNDDLKEVDTRLDFARAVAYASAVLWNSALIVIGLSFAGLAVFALTGRKFVRFPPRWFIASFDLSENDSLSRITAIAILRAVSALSLILFFYVHTSDAYKIEQDEFNKRVFGCFITWTTSDHYKHHGQDER